VPSDTSTHGFLFADLRGYTAYLERQGARAASDLLARFRDLVRVAVAAHDGAEIRTEGDSFYVVFPSASSAVACAMDIASSAKSAEPTPIQVGIGVHAGESVQTEEGPVGTAVNIAARLCAIAPAGDVLVSDTVRALTRSVSPAQFVAVGRKRLKGVEDEIRVFRAVPAEVDGVATNPRRSWPLARLALLAGLVAVLFAALALGRPLLENLIASGASSRSSEPTPTASVAPVSTYESQRFAIPFRIHLTEPWKTLGDQADFVAFAHDRDPKGLIDIILVAAVVDPPCAAADPTFIGGRPEDVIGWLTSRPWLEHSAARPYNVGRYLGRAVDIHVLKTGSEDCAALGDRTFFRLGSPMSAEFGRTWTAEVGERKRVIAIDVDGRTVTLIAGSPYDDVAQLWAEAEVLLQTITFDAR
jgi:class 3 adenylate cyclase